MMVELFAQINWHTFFFTLFALVACAFAVGVLFSSHIVHMAFYLVLSLGATAGLFFLAGAEFVGAMQLMIYVGGTLVLLVFGVMLTAQKSFISMKTRGGEWILACAVGGALLGLLVTAATSVDQWQQPPSQPPLRADIEETSRIGLALVGVHPEKLDQQNDVLRAGLSGYLLPFEIASVHLLVVLIGAAYMARAKRHKQSEVAER